ncbi:MAG: ferritin family protein [Hyphomicrobiales bacterium]|nr:ferritin family protein [Hyphomicrobiales bacterium]MCP5371289.1 ferritin family protein [Hyphomicrobiales bacterium]
MGNTGEGHSSAHERLAQMKSLDEVLDTAMSFEKTAQAFYADLAGKVRKPLRGLVTELAEEEARHFALFEGVRNHADTQAHLQDLIEIPATDHKFSDFVQAPSLGEAPDDQAILQYALGREQAAYEQYSALAEAAPTGPLQNLFRFLADEELRHKGELEKSYYEIVHSGGV